jgi:hypothetical protein
MITYNSGTPMYGDRWLNYTEPSLPPLANSAYIVRVKTLPGMQPILNPLNGLYNLFEIDTVANNVYDVKLSKDYDPAGGWEGLFYDTQAQWGENVSIIEVLGMNTVIPYSDPLMPDTPYVMRDAAEMFQGCINLRKVSCDIDFSAGYGDGSVAGMFEGCWNLKEVQNVKLTEITNIDRMFEDCSSLKSVNLQTDSALTGMSEVFNMAGLTAIPTFNVTNVVDAASAFRDCKFVESNITGMYNTLANNGHITNYSQAFRNCGISSTQGQQEWSQIPASWK